MRRGVGPVLAALWIMLAGAAGAAAQVSLPGVTYDPAIPSPQEVLGAEVGERITPSADIVRYFRALEAAAPDRVVVRSYGASWQGRELIYAIIGTPERIADLDGIADGMRRLADPQITQPGEADELIATLPGSAWLAYAVHGNEISPADAAVMTAYHLLAAIDDPVVDSILADALVFLDPVQNPDGRDRFVRHYYDTLGLEPAGSAIAAERNEPWPRGRFNHYLFDLNRDWFAITQPETRGRVAAFLEWRPLIFVDLHEMGTNTTYYFSPEAIPYNPHITESQREALILIGRNNARWFDRFGFNYFTREIFDALYPGYGAGWPLFHGAIGTTYEQASARGLTARRSDGTDLSYAQTVLQHFTASLATLETAAVNRERLLREFYDYRLSAMEEGRAGPVRSYIIPRQLDQSGADKLARLLATQGVNVLRADEPFRACRADYDVGAYVVPLDQPAGRLARTLMDPESPMAESFLSEQERRRAKDLEPELYDVTAWSLPLMFNVDVDTCGERPSGALFPVNPATVPLGSVAGPEDALAWVAPWGSTAAARFLAEALREGLPVSSSDRAFTLTERDYPAGTLIFRASEGEADMAARLRDLAVATGAELVGVNNSWVTEGPNFGSANVVSHNPPRIAIAWDRPTRATSAGNTRFVIERQIGYPVTPVRTRDLDSAELETFDVLILPDGEGYDGVLGEAGADTLSAWVDGGGVLIAMDRAVRFIADPETGLSSLRREDAFREEEGESDAGEEEEEATTPGVLLADREGLAAAQTPNQEPPDSIPGALTRAETDPDHWLAAGLKPTLNVLVTGSDIYAPARRDEAATVVSFAGPDELLAAGYLWEENRRQLAFKPFVTVEGRGRGYVIAITQDPTTRAYLDGLNVLLANALFRASAHARPPR